MKRLILIKEGVLKPEALDKENICYIKMGL